MLQVTSFGQPVEFGRCRSCGQSVGWVNVPAGHLAGQDQKHYRLIPLDPEPRAFGTVVVLADGRRGVELTSEWVGDDDRHAIKLSNAPLFCCHFATCDARGLRRAGWTAAAVVEGRPVGDPVRERIRAAKLADDRRRDRGVYRY